MPFYEFTNVNFLKECLVVPKGEFLKCCYSSNTGVPEIKDLICLPESFQSVCFLITCNKNEFER